jgi:cytochrome P450
VKSQLPPGPRMPAPVQMLGMWSRPIPFLERCRSRYGRRFTIRLLGQPPFVVLSDPEDLKEVFQTSPEILHPGEGARILEPIVGPHSVILLDEDPHMEQRKLLLPAFHGERMQGLAGLMTELAEREVDGWPYDEPVALHPRLQSLTLEIIMRAVFGLERGAQLDTLRDLLTEVLAFSESPISLLPPVQRLLAGHGPVGRLERVGEQVDELIFAVIEERRRNGSDGEDVLALLLDARHEDGSPMEPQELRDELITALVAGHETTASQLAWTFERLAHEPAVLERLVEELDVRSGEEYLTATVQEIMRHRPVLLNAEPRLVKRPVEIGGVRYPAGVVLIANAYLVHHDPEIYPEPYAFRPERFLEKAGGRPPGTYTWIPFGGGRRRCLGASFALLEMKIVLRTVLERCTLHPAGEAPEIARRRSITISPARGGRIILRARSSDRGSTPARRPEQAEALVGASALSE